MSGYNGNELDPFERIDYSILTLHEKMAEYWQDKTYTNKDSLARGFYGIAVGSLFLDSGIELNPGDYIDIALPAFLGIVNAYTFAREGSKTQLERDIERSERKELIENIFFAKYFDLFLYGSGISFIIYGAIELVNGLVNGDHNSLSSGANDMSYGVGFFSWGTANHFKRVDIDDPPAKPKKKSVRERVKDWTNGLLPHPLPNPSSGYSAQLTKELYQ